MYELRGYQEKAYHAVKKAYSKKIERVILQLDTGGGKTIIFSKIIFDAIKKGTKVIVFIYRTSLYTQTIQKLNNLGIQCEGINADSKISEISEDSSVFVCMAQTFSSRIGKHEKFKKIIKSCDFIIIDECHRQEYNFIFTYELVKKYVLGLTATPAREGKERSLHLDYGIIIQDVVTKKWLIENHFLMPCKHATVNVVDRNTVEKNKFGEYSQNSSFQKFNNRKCYSGIFDNWARLAYGEKTLLFASNIRHAVHLCNEFNNNGISAKFATSQLSRPKIPEPDSPKYEKRLSEYNEKLETYELVKANSQYTGKSDEILDQFINNQFTVLVNVDIYTTGTDVPDIMTILVARVINSVKLWYQILGRGSRPVLNKDHKPDLTKKSQFKLIDFGGNVDELGRFEFSHHWSLIHETSQKKGEPIVKECEKCGALVPVSVRFCDYCGAKLYYEKKQEKIDIDWSEQDIIGVEKKVLDTEISQYIENNKKKDKKTINEAIFRKFGREKFKEYCNFKNYSSKYYGFFVSQMIKKH